MNIWPNPSVVSVAFLHTRKVCGNALTQPLRNLTEQRTSQGGKASRPYSNLSPKYKASDGGTEVLHSTHQLKVEGSNPVPPGANFTNILRAAFSFKSFLRSL